MSHADDNFELISGPLDEDDFDDQSVLSSESSANEPEFPLNLGSKCPSGVCDIEPCFDGSESKTNTFEPWQSSLFDSMPAPLDEENTARHNFHPDPGYPFVSSSLTRPIKRLFGQTETYLVAGEARTSFSDTFRAFQTVARKVFPALDPGSLPFVLVDEKTGVVQSIFVFDGNSLLPGTFAGLEIDEPLCVKPSLFINVCGDPDHVDSYDAEILQDVPVMHVLSRVTRSRKGGPAPIIGLQNTIAPTVYRNCDNHPVIPMDPDLLEQVHPMRLVQILQRPCDLSRDAPSDADFFLRDVGTGFIKDLRWGKLPYKKVSGESVHTQKPVVFLYRGLLKIPGILWSLVKISLFLLALWNLLYENKIVNTGPQSLVRTHNQALSSPAMFSVPSLPPSFLFPASAPAVQDTKPGRGDLGTALMAVCNTTNSVTHATLRSCRHLLELIEQLTTQFRAHLLQGWNLARLHARTLIEQVQIQVGKRVSRTATPS